MEPEKFQMETIIEQKLNELLSLINQSKVIKDYQTIEEQAKNHPVLLKLVEEIKIEQKNAVKFAHYGKPIAEKAAIKAADDLTKQFDAHPLVVIYREKLITANDLLQHMTNLLEREINVHIELIYQDELEKWHQEKQGSEEG